MSKNDKRTPTERLSKKARHYREHARKIYHTTLEDAEEHALIINALEPDEEVPRTTYICSWAEDYELGQNAMKHWHVGRITASLQKQTQPRPQ